MSDPIGRVVNESNFKVIRARQERASAESVFKDKVRREALALEEHKALMKALGRDS